MRLRQRFNRFLGRYSPDQLLNTIKTLIDNMMENIKNGGGITIYILLLPFLFLAVCILYPLVLVRRILSNIVRFIKDIYLLIRKLFIVAVQEANAYWSRTRKESVLLWNDLKAIVQKMLALIQYLLASIIEPNSTYQSDIQEPNMRLLSRIIIRFFVWIGFILLSMGMSIILIATFIIGLPIIHRNKRGDFPEPQQMPSYERVVLDAEIGTFPYTVGYPVEDDINIL